MTFEDAFAACPLVAILRGIAPEEAPAIGDVLVAAGFTLIEAPTNSPRPLETVRILAERLAGRALVGAGTVLGADDARATIAAGGRIVVAPNLDPDVARAAAEGDAAWLPGVATPTEAFRAIALGAAALKLFPAEMIPPAAVKAMRAVLPKGLRLVPVGGIAPATMAAYRAAGADGFGLGSALYKPGDTPQAVAAAARAFREAFR